MFKRSGRVEVVELPVIDEYDTWLQQLSRPAQIMMGLIAVDMPPAPGEELGEELSRLCQRVRDRLSQRDFTSPEHQQLLQNIVNDYPTLCAYYRAIEREKLMREQLEYEAAEAHTEPIPIYQW